MLFEALNMHKASNITKAWKSLAFVTHACFPQLRYLLVLKFVLYLEDTSQ